MAAGVNTVAGLLLAWILVRYQFPGKSLVDALIDLPLALPTAVAGHLPDRASTPTTAVLGGTLEASGIQVAFAPLGHHASP